MKTINDIDFTKYPLPKRMRHHTSPNVYLPANELTVLPGGYPPLIDKINWSEHFLDGKSPSELDIGCGRGGFLIARSFELNGKNILGIEVRPMPVEWIEGVVKGENVPNCSVIRYSVANGMPFIESDTVDNVYYLFPDPWTKKRHQKRRAFNAEFLLEVYRVLKPGGKLFLATDVPEVHEHHLEELEIFQKFNYKLVESDEEWKLPITNKEKFCRLESIPFFRLISTK